MSYQIQTLVGNALRDLVYEARRERLTKVGLKRIRNAATMLGFSEAETQDLEYLMEYRNHETGELHPQFQPKNGRGK